MSRASNAMPSSMTLVALCAAILLIVMPSAVTSVNSDITSDQMKYFYQTVLSPANYDKRVRPDQAGAGVKVKVSLYIIKMLQLNEQRRELTISMYFRQAWRDGRLSHNGDGSLIGGGDLANLIWRPDTMFSDSSDGTAIETTVPNAFVRISPNGSVLYSSKLIQSVNCDHKLRSFPMDRLSCDLRIESCECLLLHFL